MLHLIACASTSLLVGTPTRVDAPLRAGQSPVMFGFLKDLGFEKPDFLPDFGKASAEPIMVKSTNPAIGAAAKGMPLLGPIFNVEADLQAALLNLGSYDADEVQAEIAETIGEAPVVIYTYPLSPFSGEAVSILESTGCNFKNVELGLEYADAHTHARTRTRTRTHTRTRGRRTCTCACMCSRWFALGPRGSATRVELRKLYGQGSLPHVFIGKEWVGGLATGANGGLAGLVESGELEFKLRNAKAL